MGIKLHPLATSVFLVALNVGARAAAKAFDSVLKDVGEGFEKGAKTTKRARSKLRKKVRESAEAAGFENEWKRGRRATPPTSEEE